MPGRYDDLYQRVPIRGLESQAGILQVLIYLNREGEVNFQRIVTEAGITGRSLYGSLEKLHALGLVKQRSDTSNYPPKNMISLTDKGNKIAKRLKEIEEILTTGKQ